MAGPEKRRIPVANGYKIRVAGAEDARDILNIYTYYVLHTAISFEYDVPSLTIFRERVTNCLEHFPWLLMEHEGTVIGYAYAGSHRIRQAYQWNAETSVYVAKSYKRKGIGRALYYSLFEILRQQGYQNLLAGIVLPNPASVHFHENMGFTHIGTYHRIGYKQEQWQDVGWWEVFIGDNQNPPGPIVPFREWMHNDEMLRIFADGLAQIK